MTNIAVLLSAGWDCDSTGVQEDGERVGGRIRVKRVEKVLRGRERNRGQIRASWRILEDGRDTWVVSWEDWIIGCGVDSMCATAKIWRSKVADLLGEAEKSGGEQVMCSVI